MHFINLLENISHYIFQWLNEVHELSVENNKVIQPDSIMNSSLRIGVNPGLSVVMLSFVVEKIEAFFGVNL